jgi:hypothetical protein
MSLPAFERAVWSPEQKDLWARIERHDFEPDQPFNFLHRLARDHGWTVPDAKAAIEGYKRFCFLAVTSRTQVTPSEAVDEVWHQHLIYSRDYWDIWCGQVLRKALHHDPTPGGREAQSRYRLQYAQTLALHEQFFGPPPEELWPATHKRFSRRSRYRVVDLERSFVAPRLSVAFRQLFSK